jgi:hypothetical protein
VNGDGTAFVALEQPYAAGQTLAVLYELARAPRHWPLTSTFASKQTF